MTSETGRSPATPIDPADRTIDARLARIHVRTGALGLARAELETMAGSGGLDDEALLDLAEVRWRTGDLTGAGDAARAYLATGRDDAVGFVIAAEAAAALGRPGEARRLATLALERSGQPLDPVFAGIGRSGIWPTDPADPGQPVGALFPAVEPDVPGSRRPAGFGPTGGAAVATARSTAGESAAGESATDAGPMAVETGAGLWDATAGDIGEEAQLGPDAELDAARRALVRGDGHAAAVHLGLALRLEPSSAPAVLEIAGSEPLPALAIVRGDALRVIGHDDEADRAYRSAAAAVAPTDPHPTDKASTVVHPLAEEDS